MSARWSESSRSGQGFGGAVRLGKQLMATVSGLWHEGLAGERMTLEARYAGAK